MWFVPPKVLHPSGASNDIPDKTEQPYQETDVVENEHQQSADQTIEKSDPESSNLKSIVRIQPRRTITLVDIRDDHTYESCNSDHYSYEV